MTKQNNDNVFVRVPLMQDVVERIRETLGDVFGNTAIICVQHLLETTGTLIESMLSLGARPDHIFILGKSYSMNRRVFQRLLELGVNVRVNRSEGRLIGFSENFDEYVDRLWSDVRAELRPSNISRILILDDGGHCISRIPAEISNAFQVAAVEQTTSGVKRIGKPRVPVIDVALSSAKTLIEAPLISAIVKKKLGKYLPEPPISAAVLGVGNIGAAVVEMLVERGDKVCVFDTRRPSLQEGVKCCATVTEMVDNADFIFGCTGEDALGTEWMKTVSGEKWLISCSSEDREFRSSLEYAHQHRLVSANGSTTDLKFDVNKVTVHILRGGYPVNFDRHRESVPAREIQVTRALLLAGLVQAVSALREQPEHLALDSLIQHFIVKRWFEYVPDLRARYSNELLINMGDKHWITKHSRGRQIDFPILKRAFSNRGQDMLAAFI